MVTFRPSGRLGSKSDLRQLFERILKRQLAALEKGACPIRVPHSRHLYERRPNMAYHFKPELFIQTSGSTEFFFPDDHFELEADSICVMPKGVPHGEVAHDKGATFENIVACYYNETVSIHVAHRGPSGLPTADDICFFATHLFSDLVGYLNRIGELAHEGGKASRTAIKGLLIAELSLLLSLVERPAVELFSETERVFRCQWLIRNNISDPDLGVESLAAELHCSPDYLSKVFHQETGDRIIEYITGVRLRNATDAIARTPLSVKEIAAACGFNDANYFTRVFRKMTGRTPIQYRQDLNRAACTIEDQPKAVYFDRVERGFALKPQVMAKAEARLEEEASYSMKPSTSSRR